jgi:hypothetical protein
MHSHASLRTPTPRRDASPTTDEDQLVLALDPQRGIFAGLDSLASPDPRLPVAVRGRLVGPVFEWPRVVYGRGATGSDALVSVVSAAFEQLALATLAGRRVIGGTIMGTGAHTSIDAAQVLAHGALGCGAELAGAGEHALLEACERRAVERAWAAGGLEGRLDDRAEPTAVADVLHWHRGRGCRVVSLLLGREPPVVACVALPFDDDAPALVGVAAARTAAGAWRSAATELHASYLARGQGARGGGLRERHGGNPRGRVLTVGRDHAIARIALDTAVARTRRSIELSTIAPWPRPIPAVAVEITPPIAATFGRKVVAAVLATD